MTAKWPESKLPIYHASLDWEAFFRDYPVPDVFAETVYKWPGATRAPSEFASCKTNASWEAVARGWNNAFYRQRWQAAGLEPGEVKSLEDITKIPMYNSDDVKEEQNRHPPYGEFHGITEAQWRTTGHRSSCNIVAAPPASRAIRCRVQSSGK